MYSKCLACLQNVQHTLSPSPVENLPGLGQQYSLTKMTQHAIQIYKNDFSKYLNFKLSAMYYLNIWKCIKVFQNATLLISER